MEIGSAYALQVCLLQIPALVLFSAIHGQFVDAEYLADHTFNLLFPQWDMVTVILCVFLLSYVYGEGKVRSHQYHFQSRSETKRLTEQLLQRQYPCDGISRHHRWVLPVRIGSKHGCAGY